MNNLKKHIHGYDMYRSSLNLASLSLLRSCKSVYGSLYEIGYQGSHQGMFGLFLIKRAR